METGNRGNFVTLLICAGFNQVLAAGVGGANSGIGLRLRRYWARLTLSASCCSNGPDTTGLVPIRKDWTSRPRP